MAQGKDKETKDFKHKRWTESPLEDAKVVGCVPDDFLSRNKDKAEKLLDKMIGGEQHKKEKDHEKR